MWDFEEVAVFELEFYKNMYKNLHAIETRLQEIEEEYLIFPHTYYDDELGRVFTKSSNVEDSVIWKIEAEESLLKAKERVVKRCNRVARAYNQLSGEDQDILDIMYLDDVDYSFGVKGRMLGYQDITTFKRAIRRALLKFYRFIVQEKAVRRQEIVNENREKMEKNLKEYLGQI